MKTWLTRNPANSQENVAWVELPDGRLLRLSEDGRHGVENKHNSHFVMMLLVDNDEWELIK